MHCVPDDDKDSTVRRRILEFSAKPCPVNAPLSTILERSIVSAGLEWRGIDLCRRYTVDHSGEVHGRRRPQANYSWTPAAPPASSGRVVIDAGGWHAAQDKSAAGNSSGNLRGPLPR